MIAGGGELTLSRQQCAVTKLDALARHRHDPFVMGGNQDAATQSPGGFDDVVHHQLCRCSIERGGWFVGKQQLRNGDKGSGDRHPLLLSNRQLIRPFVTLVGCRGRCQTVGWQTMLIKSR